MLWPKIKVDLQSGHIQEQILCEHLGVQFHFATLFKILETYPPASHAKQLLEGMQQSKAPEKSQSVIASKDVQKFKITEL